MIAGKKVAIVLPADNAAKTLRLTYDEIPRNWGLVRSVIFSDPGGNCVPAPIERAA